MAEYRQGDRVVKMSGVCAGKYGTVNSVREDGTLNVTFDGERLSRFCDPERCGKVAANAKFKVGDRVIIKEWAKQKTAGYGRGTIIKKVGAQFLVRPDEQSHEKYYVPTYAWNEDDLISANSRAANAVVFDNPNYDPAAGMKYLDTHFQMFDPKVAKAMIEDARRKGVKVPPGVLEKARRAGIVANAKDAFGAEVKVGDTVKFATGTFRGLVGEVVKIDGARAIVRTDEHGDVTEDLKVIRVYNSRARNANGWPNARMKFKAGDKVRHKTNGLDGVVEGWASDPGQYRVRASGRVYEWDEDDLVLANAARNARALNWNYRNSYQFFCVDPSMKAPCILSGWDYREDAKDDAAELKELGIPHKIVSRRFLEQNGIDPNDGASWKKNR